MENIPLARLNPTDSKLMLNGKEYKINKYSLYYQFQVTDKYGEEKILKAMTSESKDEKLRILTDICYLLMDDKTDFPEFKDFLKAIAGAEDEARLLICMTQVLGAAKPAITEAEQAELTDEKKNGMKPKA